MAILGAGEIGGATAWALASSPSISDILLIDPAASAAAGKALDIQQAGAITGRRARLQGTDDLNRIVGCALCVVADRFDAKGEWRGDEGTSTIARVAGDIGDAPLVFAGASQIDMIGALVSERQVDRRRLIGSAPEAMRSAATAIVAAEASCSPGDVMLAVLGVPPAGFVVAWSEGSIRGFRLQDVLTQVQLRRVDARAPLLWPPGPYALGTAAARVVTGLLASARCAFTVFTYLQGELGVRNRPGAIPARLGPHGIVSTHAPELSPHERVQLQTALGA